MHTRRRWPQLGISIAASSLVLLSAAGCAGEGENSASRPHSTESHQNGGGLSGTSSGEPPASRALQRAVRRYSDAFLTGDVAASRALLSERCQRRVGAAEWRAIVTRAGEQYGSPLELKTLDIAIAGDLARVSYTYDVAAIDQDREPWVREHGQWHEDDC